jgi:superfamily II DNA or RNA helicase
MKPIRGWQSLALKAWYPMRKNFLLVACPGAGKTRFAFEVAQQLLSQQKIDKVVFVVPTIALVGQTVDTARDFGLRVKAFETGQGVIPHDHQGFVTTYQSVCSSPEIFKHQLSDPSRVLVVLDEVHHVGDRKSWGDSIRQVFSQVGYRLLMTGTPFRSDGSEIPFAPFSKEGVLQPNWTYGFRQAWNDPQRCVRMLDHHMIDADSTWLENGILTTICGEEVDTQKQEKLLLRSMRSDDSEWLDDVVERAQQALEQTRSTEPKAQGLILAPGIASANLISEKLSQKGMSYSVVHGQMDQPHDLLEQFGSGEDRRKDWLVAVGMVSEGYDNPHLTTLVYLSAFATQLAFHQAIGRVIRRNGLNDETDAQVFVPNTPTFRRFVQELEDDLLYALEEDDEEQVSRSKLDSNDDLQSEIQIEGAKNPRLARIVRSGEDAALLEFQQKLDDPAFLRQVFEIHQSVSFKSVDAESIASRNLTIHTEPVLSRHEVRNKRDSNTKAVKRAGFKWRQEWGVSHGEACRQIWIEVNKRLGQPKRSHRADDEYDRERQVIEDIAANGLELLV